MTTTSTPAPDDQVALVEINPTRDGRWTARALGRTGRILAMGRKACPSRTEALASLEDALAAQRIGGTR